MNKLFKGLLAGAFASALIAATAAWPVIAAAVNGTSVTLTSANNATSTGLYGPLGGATTCATVNTTAANATVTVPARANSLIVIDGVYIDITSDATGTTGVATMSTTNLTGAPFWSLASIAVATNTNGFRQIAETYPSGLKAAASGVAVTFVPSAQVANEIHCIRVAAHYIDQ